MTEDRRPLYEAIQTFVKSPETEPLFDVYTRLFSEGVWSHIKHDGSHYYLEVHTPLIFVWIEQRPSYCDRGRWLVGATSKDDTRLCIDLADGFPRYYFGAEALCSELVAWLKARKQFEMKP